MFIVLSGQRIAVMLEILKDCCNMELVYAVSYMNPLWLPKLAAM